MDIGGDVGGLSACLVAVLEIICLPIAALSFKLKFLKKMYSVNTNDPSFFCISKKERDTNNKNLNQQKNTRMIRFSLYQSI